MSASIRTTRCSNSRTIASLAALEIDRTQDEVHRGRGIRHEGKLIHLRADESRAICTRCIEASLDLAPEKAHGIALHFGAQARLLFGDRLRACAE